MEGYILTRASSSHVLTFILTLVLLISSMQLAASASSSTNYILTACNSTTYPKVCYSSLSSYATQIKTNPLQLAKTALSVTLKAARNSSAIVSKILKQNGLTATEASIIKDCIENIGDSIYELKQSLNAMGQLGGSNVKFQIANIMTWLSAALTDETTCTDGFQGSKVSSTAKNKVRKSVLNVAKLTSNSLSIINNISYAL